MTTPPRREVRVATAATDEGAKTGCTSSVAPVRRREAYVEWNACGAVGRGGRGPVDWGGGMVCGCGVPVWRAWAGGMEVGRAGGAGVCAWEGARVEPRTVRVPLREGLILPFVGGGVTELDHCLMLL